MSKNLLLLSVIFGCLFLGIVIGASVDFSQPTQVPLQNSIQTNVGGFSGMVNVGGIGGEKVGVLEIPMDVADLLVGPIEQVNVCE